MERGYSVANELPPAFTPDYDSFIFNHPDHLRTQAPDWINFYLLKKVNQKVLAEVSFHLHDGKAYTPFRAPFGSFLFSNKLSPKDLYDFVKECEPLLTKHGAKAVVIKEPPLFYRSNGDLLQSILFNLGYEVSLAELSSGIKVDGLHFEERLESWEKRKWKQAKTAGTIYKALPLTDLESVYNFILKCRKQKGHQLSMTYEELSETVHQFKKNFFLFGVFSKQEIAAASIAIRVHPGILYNFYSAHLKKFDSISPIVSLVGGMYKFCSQHSIRLLDLGTSSLDGQPNFSLLDFKLRLGATPSMKLTFEKQLA